METKALRVFYGKSDNKIVWTYELRGTGKFPTTISKDLAKIPGKMPDGETSLGGKPQDYACIKVMDAQRAIAFLKSDENKIVDGKVVIGAKRITPEPIPARDLTAEIDTLEARLRILEKRVERS